MTTGASDNLFEHDKEFTVDTIAKADELQRENAELRSQLKVQEDQLETATKQLTDADELIKALTEGLDTSTMAMKVLNTKITEQNSVIMQLNNGIMKAAKIGGFAKKILN